jgi:RNA polymerase sigma-70 factor (ECF subfamily)
MGVQHPERGSSLSTSLLLRAAAREADAWERLVRLFGQTIYSRCRRRGLREDDAADLVQEVFQAAARDVGRFTGPAAGFRSWLWGIARNKLKDHWEARAKHPAAQGGSDAQRRLAELPAPQDAGDADESPATETGGLVRRALDLIRLEFEERTWKAFWRFAVDGLRAADVAAELGMSAAAVHVAVCRVRKRLREEFGDLLEPGGPADESRKVSGP